MNKDHISQRKVWTFFGCGFSPSLRLALVNGQGLIFYFSVFLYFLFSHLYFHIHIFTLAQGKFELRSGAVSLHFSDWQWSGSNFFMSPCFTIILYFVFSHSYFHIFLFTLAKGKFELLLGEVSLQVPDWPTTPQICQLLSQAPWNNIHFIYQYFPPLFAQQLLRHDLPF